jgi:hypothetical protein
MEKKQYDLGFYMKRDVSSDHPLRGYFADAVHNSLHEQLGMRGIEDVEQYLAELLLGFLHDDRIFAIRDATGRRVEAVAEMVVEGDVRLNADSFDREREVHRHIGDFLLFWSGVYPEFLKHMKAPGSLDALVDVTKQGQMSYHVVSTFEHDPYGAEAPTFRKLSEDFEAFRVGLSLVRASFEGFARQGWTEGFQA